MSGPLQLPSGWRTYWLDEVVEILDSKRIPLNATQRSSRHGPYPYYGANGRVDSVDGYLFEGEHILVAEDGGYFDDPLRPVAYRVNGRFWVNNHAHVLKAKDRFDSVFLMHALNTVEWMAFVSGTTRLKLTQSALRRVQIQAPELDEQHRIVARVEELLEQTRRVRRSLEEISGDLPNFLAALEANGFASHTTLCPDGSPDATLGELIEEGPQNGLYVPKELYGRGVPIIRIEDYQIGWIRPVQELQRVEVDAVTSDKYRLRTDDVLVNRVNSPSHLGKCISIPATHAGCLFESNMMRFRLKPTVVSGYVVRYLQSAQGRAELTRDAKWAVNQASINQGDVARMLVPNPPSGHQNDMARRLALWDTLQRSLTERTAWAVEQLNTLNRSLLSRAFRGEPNH